MPPPDTSAALYAVPTWPFGSVEVVMTNAAGEMVSAKLAVWVRTGLLESVTLNVSGVALAVAVGVPVMAPVAALSVKPAGNVPLLSDQV